MNQDKDDCHLLDLTISEHVVIAFKAVWTFICHTPMTQTQMHIFIPSKNKNLLTKLRLTKGRYLINCIYLDLIKGKVVVLVKLHKLSIYNCIMFIQQMNMNLLRVEKGEIIRSFAKK